ncbi:MAG TPA: type II toxin-antitoxin system RelE/ParE family toxin [Gammaproteobacteria bacterium]|nr:type II toxin-antitoxin system RelE/ParE family toxin [Gammaproteobacteria bacterium]
MTHLVITEPAKNDLHKIWAYTAENSYVEYADGQLDGLLAGCELLCQQPEMGTERTYIARGLRLFPIGRFNIYYRLQENTLFVVHVVDAARDIKNIDF